VGVPFSNAEWSTQLAAFLDTKTIVVFRHALSTLSAAAAAVSCHSMNHDFLHHLPPLPLDDCCVGSLCDPYKIIRRRVVLSELLIHSWCGACLGISKTHYLVQQSACRWSGSCPRHPLHVQYCLIPLGGPLPCESASPLRLTTHQVWVPFGYQFPTRFHCRLGDCPASVSIAKDIVP